MALGSDCSVREESSKKKGWVYMEWVESTQHDLKTQDNPQQKSPGQDTE